MHLEQFLDRHAKAANEYMDGTVVVYSITYYRSGSGKLFVDDSSEVTYKKYYYFEGELLARVDKGERAVDLRIQVDGMRG